MRILVLHNSYRQRGGEDVAVERETAMLGDAGHDVQRFTLHNADIDNTNQLRVAGQAIWSRRSERAVRTIIRDWRPDVCHFHNTFPLISPAAYYACKAADVPVVQTLHNYRLLCPAAFLYREGSICEECRSKRFQWPAIRHACYRGSHAGSAVVAMVTAAHGILGTWHNAIDLYLTPSEFAREQFVKSGLPADRVRVKPNFVHPDPGVGAHDGGFALFVGRLAPEKGLRTLLEAWHLLEHPIPLKIVGSGPLAHLSESTPAAIEWLGERGAEEVRSLMESATFLVFPSEGYETFGLTIAEAFATGLPVVCSRIGAPPEIVSDRETGLHFEPGNAAELARRVEWLWFNREEAAIMGARARVSFELHYTAARNCELLVEAYGIAAERKPRTSTVPPSRGAERSTDAYT